MNNAILFDNYLRDELTAEELRELKRRLTEEPAMAQEFVAYVYETGLMIHVASRLTMAVRTKPTSPWRAVRWLPLAAVAASVLVAVGVWKSVGGRGSGVEEKSGRVEEGAVVARVTEVSDQFLVISDQYGKRKAEVGAGVREGMRIETGTGGRVKFAYVGEETEMETGERSTFDIQLSPSKEGKNLFLERGRLGAVVAKQETGREFVVRTPHAELTVVGTKLEVTALEDRTRLMVQEGTVKMRAAGATEAEDVGSGAVAVVRQGGKGVVRPGVKRRVIDIKAWGLGTAEGVAFDGKRVWLYFLESGTLVAMDPDSRKIEKQVKLEAPFPESPSGTTGLAWDGKSLWGWGGPRLLRAVDPESGKTLREIGVPLKDNSPFDIYDGNMLMLRRDMTPLEIWVVDLVTGKTLKKTPIAMSRQEWLCSMSSAQGLVFAGTRGGHTLHVFDTDDGRELYELDLRLQNCFTGGDMAYDPRRGLWCSSLMGQLVLVEVE